MPLVWAALALLAGAALALLPLGNRLRAGFGLASQALATLLTWSVVVPVLGGAEVAQLTLPWGYPIGEIRFRLDPLGAFFLAWSLPMTLLGAVYAVGYLGRYFDSRRHLGVHFALLNTTALSFLMVYTGEHAVTFLMGWEIAALSAWLLVIWDYSNQKVRFAGFNYLVSTHIGLIFLVAAFMILYAQTQSWFLDDFGDWMSTHPGTLRNGVFLLLVTSFGLKSAFFPFHSWLPRAHAAAPAHVSALMSGVIHKAGLFALLHFLWVQGQPDEWMGWFLIAFGALSAVVGGLYTVGQRDLKRLLGYSSTENVGIAGMGFGVGCLGLSWGQPLLTVLGFGGGLLHIVNHAFFKCQLFYAAGCVYQAKHGVDIERLGGLARLMPFTASCFLVGGLAISGLPPFNGFISEFVLYSGFFNAEVTAVWARVALVAVAAALAFVGAVSCLSITRAYGVVFMGQARDPSLPAGHEPSLWMRVPLLLHTLGSVGLGLWPLGALALVRAPVAQFLQRSAPVQAQQALAQWADLLARLGWVTAGVAALLALAWGLARLSRRTQALGPTWGCGYAATNPRMQYSGASFAKDFAANYGHVLALVERRKVPQGYFPRDAYVVSECADAVERRLYRVIGEGDASAGQISRLMHEDDPRLGFAIGLAALLALAAMVLLGWGALV